MTDKELTDLAMKLADNARQQAAFAAADTIVELYEDHRISELAPSQQDELFRRFCARVREHEQALFGQSMMDAFEYVIDGGG